MSYIGNEPIVSATRTITEITATAGQTVFVANGGYTVGYIDVFVNGAQLQTSDFTATNGSSITLITGASIGDDIRLVAWGTFSTAVITPAAVSDQNNTSTGAFDLPAGTTAQRPASPNNGMTRFNTTLGYPEWYNQTINGWFPFYDSGSFVADYLVVAGGGAGNDGFINANFIAGGGGGAGGMLTGTTTITNFSSLTVTVGAGAAYTFVQDAAASGSNSSLASIAIAIGGGGGGKQSRFGRSGGSGGGDGGNQTGNASGTSGQGNNGGPGSADATGGGGGGKGSAGGSPTAGSGSTWLDGTTYAVGGTGGFSGSGNGASGAANRGNGGNGAEAGSSRSGGNGGSGVVILRYLGPQRSTGGTVTSSGGYTYHTFTSSGTFTA